MSGQCLESETNKQPSCHEGINYDSHYDRVLPHFFPKIFMGFEHYKQFCERGQAHQTKEIIMICLSQECQAKRLCCVVCIDHLHQKHQLVSLQKFEQMLAVLTHKRDSDLKAKVVELLSQFQSQVEKDLEKRLEAFNKFILNCKQRVKGMIDSAKQSVSITFSSEHLLHLYQNLNNQNVCKYLTYIKQAEDETLKDVASTKRELAKANIMVKAAMYDSFNHFQKSMEDITLAVNKLEKIFSYQGMPKTKLFSKLFKAGCIEINAEQNLAKRTGEEGSYPIVLLEQPLTKFNNSFTVVLKEQPAKKTCWLGVCVYDIVKNSNFSNCYEIGKGCWAIDQFGLTQASAFNWSHHDATHSQQPNVGFQFLTGDAITVKVDFAKSSVAFIKGQNVYEMPIQLHLGDIYPFVGCTHLGDTWAIVPT